MKKQILFILLFIVPFTIIAQQYSNKEKAKIAENVDSLIYNFMSSSTLRVLDSNKYNPEVAREFKSLFLSDAKIYGDMTPKVVENIDESPYIFDDLKLTSYYGNLIENYKKGGLSIENKSLSIKYDSVNNNLVSVLLARVSEGYTSESNYHFRNQDTLLIKIAVQPDKTVKIKQISLFGEQNFKCLNDMDNDGVIDEEDECSKEKGLISLKGCPDFDGDGTPDKDDDCPKLKGLKSNNGCPETTFAYRYAITGFAGIQFNSHKYDMPKTSDLGFKENEYDAINTGAGAVNGGKTKSQTSFVFGGQLAYYFGKKSNRSYGFSLGFTVTPSYTINCKLDGVKYAIRAFDNDNVNDANAPEYYKLITMLSGTEILTYRMLNVPFLLRYRFKFNKDFACELSGGPSYITTLLMESKKEDVRFNFEGIYRLDASDNIVSFNNSNDLSNDILLTADGIANNSTGNAQTLFEMLIKADQGYDFALNKPIDKDKNGGKVKPRSSIAINANADFFYHIKPKIAIKLGTDFTATNFKKNNVLDEDKHLITKSTGEYNSFHNGQVKDTYFAYGIYLGIIIAR